MEVYWFLSFNMFLSVRYSGAKCCSFFKCVNKFFSKSTFSFQNIISGNLFAAHAQLVSYCSYILQRHLHGMSQNLTPGKAGDLKITFFPCSLLDRAVEEQQLECHIKSVQVGNMSLIRGLQFQAAVACKGQCFVSLFILKFRFSYSFFLRQLFS